MRDYKFRGKRLDTGEWVYGSLIQMNQAYSIMSHDVFAHPGWQRFEVDPKTVGQYTGLKDKNGTEAYSGMWVIDDTLGHKTVLGQIVWLNEVDDAGMYTYGYYIQKGNAARMITQQLSPLMVGKLEVADNPTLLSPKEGGKQ
jgi:hypothetical protein